MSSFTTGLIHQAREPLVCRPGRRWLPEKARNRADVPDDAAHAIRGLTAGGAGWAWPLVLIGEVGSGKTCAVLCMLDHFGGHFTEAVDFCERLRWAEGDKLQTSNGYKVHPAEVWREWTEPHLAVMDELGTRDRVTDFQYETIKRAMDKREGKPTVYLSNFGLTHIAKVYDDRIASRLSAGTVIEMHGDRRQDACTQSV